MLVACTLERARDGARAAFRKELSASQEVVERLADAAAGLGPPDTALEIVHRCLGAFHKGNRSLYVANAELLVRRGDASVAAGVGRSEARQLVRKFLLTLRLDPPIAAIYTEYEAAHSVVDRPQEYDYMVLNEATCAMRRAVWRDLTLLLTEVAEGHESCADQVFDQLGRQGSVHDFVDAYIAGCAGLVISTSLPGG